jgi:hypothetical protein
MKRVVQRSLPNGTYLLQLIRLHAVRVIGDVELSFRFKPDSPLRIPDIEGIMFGGRFNPF